MTLGVGLVGCGRIANKHAELLAGNDLQDMHLAAVCDLKQDRAKAMAEKYSVECAQDMHALAKNPKVDVIAILTESGSHAKNTIELAQYRKHIVVEKPMALTLSDADMMIRECDRNGIKLFVVKQNRFNKPVVALRRAIEEKRFGKLVLGTVRVRWCRTDQYYNQDSWRGTWAQDGGVLTNQASHHIDLLQWMMGDVESVSAYSTTALANIETEDTAVVSLKFANGALGIIEATTATRPKDLEGSISILGEKGSVEVGGFAVNEIKHWNFIEHDDFDDRVVKDSYTNPPNVYGFGHKEFYQQVSGSIFDKRENFIDGLEGKKSLELICAIYESIETGMPVQLRFKSKLCKLGS